MESAGVENGGGYILITAISAKLYNKEIERRRGKVVDTAVDLDNCGKGALLRDPISREKWQMPGKRVVMSSNQQLVL